MIPQSMLSPNVLHELMETARATPPGPLVEIGVYKGGSAAHLAQVAREQGRELWLFDTFEGIPFQDPARDFHKVGDFSDTSLEAVRAALPDAICVPGIFPSTLPGKLDGVALAHIDCDQYDSVRQSALSLGPRMAAGGVMVFDDYDVLQGARQAVDELFGDRVRISAQGKARVSF
jgi:predicted O-methyltransferase YrrM